MIKIYYPNDKLKKEKCYDWMGYEIDEDNFLTYHHIVKASSLRSNEKSQKATIDNGACLGSLSHSALHFIESIDKELYNAWNKLFLAINKSRKPIDEETEALIEELQFHSNKAIENYQEEKSKEKAK